MLWNIQQLFSFLFFFNPYNLITKEVFKMFIVPNLEFLAKLLNFEIISWISLRRILLQVTNLPFSVLKKIHHKQKTVVFTKLMRKNTTTLKKDFISLPLLLISLKEIIIGCQCLPSYHVVKSFLDFSHKQCLPHCKCTIIQNRCYPGNRF